MKIAFNPSTVAALTSPPDNKDITFDLRGHNIFARGVKFQGTDTNTWRDIKINNVSIGSHTLDLRNGSNTTLTNTNGVVIINSTWRPVVDSLTSNSTTSSLSANQGRVLAGLINGKSDSDHNHDDRYVKRSGDTMSGVLTIDTTNFGALTIKRNDDVNGASIQFRGKSSVYGYIGLNNSTKDKQFLRWNSDVSKFYTILDTSSTYTSSGKGVINGTTITQVDNATNATNSTNARKLVNWYSARPTSLNAQFGDGSLRIFYATPYTTEGKPAEDSHILHLAWDNTDGWDAQLAVHRLSGKVSTRAQSNGTWQPWKTLAFTTDIPSSLKNPASLNTFGVVYDGSAAKTVTTSNFISQVNEGTSTITDGTMLITSYASNSGFADTNAVNVPYKRKAVHLWEYIKGKTDSLYATKGHNHDDRYLKLTGGIMSGTIYRNSGGHTISGRDHAIIRQTYAPGISSWNPIACVDTETGTWTLGHLSSIDSNTNFHFCFSTNTDYNAGNNNGNYVTLRNKVGTIALLSEIPDKNSWNYDDRYLKLTGGTMNGNARIGHSSGNLYIGNSDNDGWVAVQDICSQGSIGDGIWSIRVNGTATFNYIKSNTNAYIVGNLEAGQIIRGGSGQMWINGRNGALLRETSVSGYHTLWSLKTTDGSWDFGEYNAGSNWNNVPVLSYITDSNYNSGDNTPTYQIRFPLASGTVALTSNIPNPTNYYWANVKISTSSSTTTSPTVSKLTATRVCAGHDPGIDNSISCSNWFRSSGNTGWYNTTYSGGWYMSDTSWIKAYNGVGIYTSGQMKARGFHHESVDSDNYILLAGGGYKSFGGDDSTPIFLGYLNLDHGNGGTVSSSFYCLGYSVPFTYTRGGNYCRISIPDTTRLSFYINAAIASVNYSGGGMDTWVGYHRGTGAWWLHCYASGWNEVRVKGFCQANGSNDSWWGGNPLGANNDTANRITVCIFGHVRYK